MDNAIVITGGASGIGAAAIDRLLAHGRPVINLDLQPNTNPDIIHIHCDLASEASIDAALARLPDTIFALLNVAGVSQGKLPGETVMAVNFLGLRHLTEQAMARVIEGGRIVLVASSAGRDWRSRRELIDSMLATRGFKGGLEWLQVNTGAWQAEPYRFSKQCAAAYTYRAAGLARARNISVNCVNPGIVNTQLSPDFREMVGPARYDWIVAQSGRAGTPTDIAPIIEFLAVGDSQWLNGVEITVDGGYFAGLEGRWIDPGTMPTD
ncbi:MAG: SDR family NAD(P)-dependent oxidoreductase [Pseudomonadota bacterium]